MIKKLFSEPLTKISKEIILPEPIKKLVRKIPISESARFSRNYLHLDRSGLLVIENSIKENYFTGWRSEANYSAKEFRDNLNDHVYKRLEKYRREIIPWIDSAAPLKGKRILDIGCNTGSTTVALIEQGAKYIGIDINENAIEVAKTRILEYGLDAELRSVKAKDIFNTFYGKWFDLIIFNGSLAHMTVSERLTSLSAAWAILPANGLLVVLNTPNRLWYFDNHTSQLPFYHWLPNELAFAYSKFSDRENFSQLYHDYDADSKEMFLRRGRGVSFHEFDIALGQSKNLHILSSLSSFRGIRYRLKYSKIDEQYKTILKNTYPHIHEGFFDDYLDLIIKKE